MDANLASSLVQTPLQADRLTDQPPVRSPRPPKAMSDRQAVILLALLVLVTFGAPPTLGLSWFELPQTVFNAARLDTQTGDRTLFAGTPLEASANAPRARGLSYLTSLDVFSFAHVDRPFRAIEAQQILHGKLPLWNARSSLGVPL